MSIVKPILLVLTLYDAPADVAAKCFELGTVKDNALGCAVVSGNQCHVHMAKPQAGYPHEMIFPHEVSHCAFGNKSL